MPVHAPFGKVFGVENKNGKRERFAVSSQVGLTSYESSSENIGSACGLVSKRETSTYR